MEKQNLLAKVAFLNMIVAFAVAFKHRLRFEPYIQNTDLYDLVSHTDTLTKDAGAPMIRGKKERCWRCVFNALYVAPENPRAGLKRTTRPLGNLPTKILSYMYTFLDDAGIERRLKAGDVDNKILDSLHALDDILVTSDRISNTPFPIAYTITISQIIWNFLVALPFQLVHLVGWISCQQGCDRWWSGRGRCGPSNHCRPGLSHFSSEAEGTKSSSINISRAKFCAKIGLGNVSQRAPANTLQDAIAEACKCVEGRHRDTGELLLRHPLPHFDGSLSCNPETHPQGYRT